MDPRLLELLVCPVTKGPLDYDRERQELLSREGARIAEPTEDDESSSVAGHTPSLAEAGFAQLRPLYAGRDPGARDLAPVHAREHREHPVDVREVGRDSPRRRFAIGNHHEGTR